MARGAVPCIPLAYRYSKVQLLQSSPRGNAVTKAFNTLLESQDLADVCGSMLHRALAWLCFHLPNAVVFRYDVYCSKSVSNDQREGYGDRRRTLPCHATSESSTMEDVSLDASVTCSGRRPEPYDRKLSKRGEEVLGPI